MKILLNTTPLGNAHAIRGIGMYTRMLQQKLNQLKDIELVSKPPADLIHYPFFDLFFDTLPIKKQLPTVVTIHDVIPLLFPKHYPIGIKGKARFLKQKLALKNVEAIITDSYASKWDIVSHLHIPAAKVHVVYLAANPDLVPPAPKVITKVREKYQLPETYILYVGDINYNKNLPQLIKSVKFLPPHIHLVCVGKNFTPQDIPEWQNIERQIALSDVSSQVHFLNTVASDKLTDLAAIYHEALCYVQPSLAEGFGLPILEAMQCQTPVIAAGNSSLVEIGGDAVEYTGTEAEAIAQSVERLSKWTRVQRKERIKHAFNWSQQFSWEKTAKATQSVYTQIVASQSV